MGSGSAPVKDEEGEKPLIQKWQPQLYSSDYHVPSSSKNAECLICKTDIVDSEIYFSTCACKSFAHVSCASMDEYWVYKRCPNCKQLYNKGDDCSVCMPGDVADHHVSSRICVLCNNTKHQEKTAAESDSKLIRPCFCEVRCHHGCMLDILRFHGRCHLCGVQFRFIKYGSTKDYFFRYACHYLTFSVLIVFISSLASFSIYQSLSSQGSFSLARWLLLVIGCSLMCLSMLCIFWCCRHTIFHRIPRFRKRYGQITVLNYEPDPRHSSKNSNERLFGDISFGQYLFGKASQETWQSSSTPLAPPGQQVKFTFDTPCISETANETCV